MGKLKRHFKGHATRCQETSLKVLVDDGFLWFSQSRTEGGVMRVIADASSQAKAEQLLREGCQLVQASG